MRYVAILALLLTIPAHAAGLKQGVFVCEDSAYAPVKLQVRQHPDKPNKAILNWDGRDRIVHRESSVSGALRYEGAVSKILYLQTPHHSVLLNDATKSVILSECTLQ